MHRIVRQHFRVDKFASLSEFYCGLLGMQEFENDVASKTFGFDPNQCCLTFTRKPVLQYESGPDDFYWKIGIILCDLDFAIDFLRKKGVVVPDPYQFRDIGYMSKITDPNGFIIELLQQGFEGNKKPPENGHPFGVQATLAHITLRISDLPKAKAYFEGELSMRLVSVQPIDEYGFCLYFYTWSAEVLPEPDLASVGNREWLWRRPYTFIELQHLENPGASIQKTDCNRSGFDGFSYVEHEGGKPIYISNSVLEKLV